MCIKKITTTSLLQCRGYKIHPFRNDSDCALPHRHLFFRASTACASWSGQLVCLLPQVTPRNLFTTSSASMPSTRRDMPHVLPWHPPRNVTLCNLLSSSMSTFMSLLHVPCVGYVICFICQSLFAGIFCRLHIGVNGLHVIEFFESFNHLVDCLALFIGNIFQVVRYIGELGACNFKAF